MWMVSIRPLSKGLARRRLIKKLGRSLAIGYLSTNAHFSVYGHQATGNARWRILLDARKLTRRLWRLPKKAKTMDQNETLSAKLREHLESIRQIELLIEHFQEIEAKNAALQEYLESIRQIEPCMENSHLLEALKAAHAHLDKLQKDKSFMVNIRQFQAASAELHAQLKILRETKPLMEHIRKLQSEADKIGKPDPAFDMKKFTDEMWDGA